tara:strand:+ start:286 stop:609 length:324 start_codon:yes stop_codon:yes gene_type:complete
MNGIDLKDILEKREEIMKKESNDEYIQVPDDNDDVSTGSFKLYHQRREIQRYNFGKSMHELTEAVKLYLEKERIRKVNWAIGKCLLGFTGVSVLIVFNDFILINYIL